MFLMLHHPLYYNNIIHYSYLFYICQIYFSFQNYIVYSNQYFLMEKLCISFEEGEN